MSKPVIRLVVYISSTNAVVWDALTNPDVTEKYWGGTRLESDWNEGSELIYRCNGEVTDRNTVLKVVPGIELSYTFEPTHEQFIDEPASRATLLLSDNGQVVRLTLVHDNFEIGSKLFSAWAVSCHWLRSTQNWLFVGITPIKTSTE